MKPTKAGKAAKSWRDFLTKSSAPNDAPKPAAEIVELAAPEKSTGPMEELPSYHGDALVEAGLAVIATNAWKMQGKMLDAKTGEPREEVKRLYHHLEAIMDCFPKMQLQVQDHTGEIFDYGLPLTVVAAQPTAGIARERVIETIKPTIYLNEKIIQMGEVVIATPLTN